LGSWRRSGLTLPATGQALALEGFLLDPQGNAAPGAVVVSSAGGKAVTEVDGGYRIVVDEWLGAESVQLTAVSSAGANSRERASSR
jgi:hypothetical protein